MTAAASRTAVPGTLRVTAVRQSCTTVMASIDQWPKAWLMKWVAAKVNSTSPDHNLAEEASLLQLTLGATAA